MLESNTDRSYFMIGAVIVAAILIAGATFIFRDVLFFNDDAVIPTMMDNIFGQANEMITNIDDDSGLAESP
jgi:hypothetical protein